MKLQIIAACLVLSACGTNDKRDSNKERSANQSGAPADASLLGEWTAVGGQTDEGPMPMDPNVKVSMAFAQDSLTISLVCGERRASGTVPVRYEGQTIHVLEAKTIAPTPDESDCVTGVEAEAVKYELKGGQLRIIGPESYTLWERAAK